MQSFGFNRDKRKLLSTMDLQALSAVRESFESDRLGYAKYFDVPLYIDYSLRRAYRLNLKERPKTSILDIGCGFGYFGATARYFGHDFTGLDYDAPEDKNTALFKAAFETINPAEERISFRIEKNTPLPNFSGRFDIITAFQICFTNFNQAYAWGSDEWQYFLKDLPRALTSNGEILLHFSKPRNSELFRPPEVERVFQDLGADINGPYVSITREAIVNWRPGNDG